MFLQMTCFHSFYGWVVFHCTYIPHLLHPFICRRTFGLFPCLGYCELCCYEHKGACIFLNYSFGPDICPGVGLLDHMVILFLVFWGTSILFSIVAAPIYIPWLVKNLSSTFIIAHQMTLLESDCERSKLWNCIWKLWTGKYPLYWLWKKHKYKITMAFLKTLKAKYNLDI